MEVGHVVNIDGEDYCISDIQLIGNQKFCLTTYGQNENSNISFFKLTDDEQGGTMMEEVVDELIINELLKVFLYS